MNPIKNLVLTPFNLWLLFLSIPVISFSEYSDVRVVKSNDTKVVFEYNAEELIISYDGKFHSLRLKGCSFTDEKGLPSLPIRFIRIGIPLNSNVNVKVSKKSSQAYKNILAEPVPEIFYENGVDCWNYRVDERFYGRDLYYPEGIVIERKIGFLRNQRILLLQISPVQYNPLKRKLIFHKEIEIEVSFSPPAPKFGIFEADPFEIVYKRLILNYENSKKWRMSKSKLDKKYDPFLTSSVWYKIYTEEDGLYKITYDDLHNAGIHPEIIDPKTIKLYNGGSKILPESTGSEPELKEVPIYIEGETDGRFDKSDFIIFYGLALSRWKFDTDYYYYENPYEDENVYWLTWGGDFGERILTKDGSLTNNNPVSPEKFYTASRREENRVNVIKSPFVWDWEEISDEVSKNYTFSLHGVDTEEKGSFLAMMKLFKPSWQPASDHRFKIFLNDVQLVDTTLWMGPTGGSPRYVDDIVVEKSTLALKEGENVVKVEHYREAFDPDVGEILVDYFETRYNRKFNLWDDRLKFTLPEEFDSGVYEFTIVGSPSTPFFLIDITDSVPVRIINCSVGDNYVRFQDSIDKRRFYILSGFNGLKKVTEIELADLVHLRSCEGFDYVIITDESLYDAAVPLSRHREKNLFGFSNTEVKIVKISQIYDEFSWGLLDPTAIRDFLKYTFDNCAVKPSYCFLFGAGNYDYKNYLHQSNPANFVPPKEPGCRDDWYVSFNDGMSMCIGRATVETPKEARAIVDRIIDYETKGVGYWKNRILLMADDKDRPGSDQTEFARDTEILASEHTPPHFDIRKIFMELYPVVGARETKPAATAAAVAEWSQGFFAGCFMGHGGAHQIAQEKLLMYTDLLNFKNGRKLPFFYFASCDVGRFDVPGDFCFGGKLLKLELGGAVATLASSREAYHTANAYLAFNLFDCLLDTTTTIGMAVLSAKGAPSQHILFGDPAIVMSTPLKKFQLFSEPDSMKGRSKIKVWTDTPIHNRTLIAYDSAKDKNIVYSIYAKLPGDPVYKGTFKGDTLHFIVPISVGVSEGDEGRIICYAWDDTVDVVGVRDALYVGGVVSVPPDSADTMGPSVVLLANGRKLKNFDYVPSSFKLEGIVEDLNGINLVESFSLKINGSDETDLSKYFYYDAGSYQRGTFICDVSLNEGENKLEVNVTDNFGNPTFDSVVVNVSPFGELSIIQAFNYPNPFSEQTYFHFYLTQSSVVDLKIFTVAGRRIKRFNIEAKENWNQICWDGLDDDGDEIANGVYIYKLVAKGKKMESGYGETPVEAEYTGKCVIMR